jgi:hypothetical protein
MLHVALTSLLTSTKLTQITFIEKSITNEVKTFLHKQKIENEQEEKEEEHVN